MKPQDSFADKLKKLIGKIDFTDTPSAPAAEAARPESPKPVSKQQQKKETKRPANNFSKGRPSHGKPHRNRRGGKGKFMRSMQGDYPSFFTYKKESHYYKPPYKTPKDVLRIIPLGGCEEIGQNSTIFEYGDDMILVDYGMQFSQEFMRGVNYIIPDAGYLYKNKHKLKAIVITHGHLDHIGGITHLMKDFKNIPIYGSNFTLCLVKKRLEEAKIKGQLREVKDGEHIQAGALGCEFFRVNHTVPGCFGLVIKSELGSIIHTGDWKYDPNPIGEPSMSWEKLEQIAKRDKILALMADSTNVSKEGHSMSESDITENLEEIIKYAKGRCFISIFSTLLARTQQVINIAQKYNRKIVIEGRSLKTNTEVAKRLQYLKYDEKIFISSKEMSRYPDEQIIVMCTGAQGEENAVLMRVASKRHQKYTFQPTDSIIFSSSIVPGNEMSVENLRNIISRSGAKIHHYRMTDIHAGGHCHMDETIKMYNTLKPKYFIPIHGSYYQRTFHSNLMQDQGHQKKDVFLPDNGQPIEFYPDDTAKLLENSVGGKFIAVDGKGVGDVSLDLLLERYIVGNGGFVVLFLSVDKVKKTLRMSPYVVSRGFVVQKKNPHLIEGIQKTAKDSFAKHAKNHDVDSSEFRSALQTDIEHYIVHKIDRKPMIVPIIMKT